MYRNIFVVNAMIVDSNGTFNVLSGYPKTFDSHNYNDDIDKALRRARAEYHETIGAMYKRDDRQLQSVTLTGADSFQIEPPVCIGRIADLPDPEPEPEEEEIEPEGE